MANQDVNIDINSLTKVETIHKRKAGQNYDIAYSNATGKFRMSEDAWEKLNMGAHGFDMFVDGNGNVILGLVSEDDAQMYQRRFNQETGEKLGKGHEATNRKMRTYLEEKFGAEVTDYALTYAGTNSDGVSFYVVQPWNDKIGSTLEFVGNGAQETEDVSAEDAAEAIASSEEGQDLLDEDELFGEAEEEVEETAADPFEV